MLFLELVLRKTEWLFFSSFTACAFNVAFYNLFITSNQNTHYSKTCIIPTILCFVTGIKYFYSSFLYFSKIKAQSYSYTAIFAPPFLHRHSCTAILAPPFLHRHSYTAILTPPFLHRHSCTAILTPPFLHPHSYTAILAPPSLHRHPCKTIFCILKFFF